LEEKDVAAAKEATVADADAENKEEAW